MLCVECGVSNAISDKVLFSLTGLFKSAHCSRSVRSAVRTDRIHEGNICLLCSFVIFLSQVISHHNVNARDVCIFQPLQDWSERTEERLKKEKNATNDEINY